VIVNRNLRQFRLTHLRLRPTFAFPAREDGGMDGLPKRERSIGQAFSRAGRANAANAVIVHNDLPMISKFRPRRLSSQSYDKCTAGLRGIDSRSADVCVRRESTNRAKASSAKPLYTSEERRRRDNSYWTIVQGILAPLQFAVFLVSIALVLHYLITGEGLTAATVSIVIKTFVLYAIMVTGSLWEHDVYGRYLFASAFFWEDAMSMLVLALHTAYLAALATGALEPREQMFLALAAYVTYLVNAAQFLLKLRAARLGGEAANIVSLAP
jgi:3-vinyl bacteriochlorophyllide hydratase